MKRLTSSSPRPARPGTAALLRALRENGEREVRLVGTDMSERSVGRHLCDAFHVVPAGSDPGFADAMLEVCRQRGRRRGAAAVVVRPPRPRRRARRASRASPCSSSSPDAIRRSNDKAETLRAARPASACPARPGGASPAARAVAAAAHELGYPGEDVCMKPVFSSGSRGFRILSASADRREQLLTNRPGVAEAMRLEELVELLGDDRETELLVMELATRRRAHDRRLRATAGASCSATRRRARRCAPAWRCTSRRSTTPG